MAEPLPDSDEEDYGLRQIPERGSPAPRRPGWHATARTGEPTATGTVADEPAPRARSKPQGRVLGRFRNTYYDLPNERDYEGPTVELMSPRCKPIGRVPRGFFESLCVQGSGTLSSGSTVSFARRDCECAEVCPRTGQRICFDLLDATRFPWGRGATGKPITPLLTVAVDPAVIPLSTPIYVPEYDGLPRDETQTSFHDGCFVAEDRGLRVVGKQIDVFTGHASVTRLWNKLVPSNQGVTVVVDSPHCARVSNGDMPGAE